MAEKRQIVVYGDIEEETDNDFIPQEFPKEFENVHTQVVVTDSSRADTTKKELTQFRDDDVVLIEFDNGIKQWISLEQFREDYGVALSRDVKGKDELVIPSTVRIGDAERGLGEWGIKALSFLGFDLAGAGATKIAGGIESGLKRPAGRLHRCELINRFGLTRSNGHFEPGKPVLIFIHGTASSTEGSFSDLWQQQEGVNFIREARSLYGANVYGFEHKTLSESPIRNALELVREIERKSGSGEARVQVHLISHSRGGLVGELVARANVSSKEPFTKELLEQFREQATANDVRDLDELIALLSKPGFSVERFVRVACPARGTTLASGRLDKWLSVFANLLETVTGGNLLIDALSAFAIAVAKERTDPATLPGLEAQMPGSALIRLLNLPPEDARAGNIESELAVISGVAKGSFWKNLAYLLPTAFFGRDHDLVVDTISMTGGGKRARGMAYVYEDESKSVNHFSYFGNPKAVGKIIQGLKKASVDLGFDSLDREERRLLPGVRGREKGAARGVVVLLPGILGSHLQRGNDRIWLDPFELAFGGLRKIAKDAQNISAEASCLQLSYGRFIEYLEEQSLRVVQCPYDWRLPISRLGKEFGRTLMRQLNDAKRDGLPLTVVAHSMGGLVARAALHHNAALWSRIVDSGGRLLMFGTPNGGSHAMVRMLLGQDKLIKNLALLDLRNDEAGLLEIIAGLDGVLNLLPWNHGSHDYFAGETWQRLLAGSDAGQRTMPDGQALERAAMLRDELYNFGLHRERVLYIAGKAPVTPVDVEIGPQPGAKPLFKGTTRGDGRVSWDSAMLNGVSMLYMDAAHGDLLNHEPAFSAIRELIETGVTEQGSVLRTEPLLTRGAREYVSLPEDMPDMFPDAEILEISAMAASGTHVKAEHDRPLSVSIGHGNLRYARNIIIVGHYDDDTIMSAEAYIDNLFGGRLRKRLNLRLYPGRLNTSEIIDNPSEKSRPPASLIVGLGEVGKLTQMTLVSTVTDAVLKYVVAVSENRVRHEPASRTELSINSLLIGTGPGGLSVRESVSAIIRGVLAANDRLKVMEGLSDYRIASLEFIELWEHLCICAAHEIGKVKKMADIEGRITNKPAMSHGDGKSANGAMIQSLGGGLAKMHWDEDAAWWSRIQITREMDDKPEGPILRYQLLTYRARSEVMLHALDLRQVDAFVNNVITHASNAPELSETLFEMLIPYELKQRTIENRNLVLVLNEKAAQYPWELLQNRSGNLDVQKKEEPLCVQNGLLRQLESHQYRPKPLMTNSNRVLVVGDPKSDFPVLKGAEEEAIEVGRLLRGYNYDVTSIIGKDPDRDAGRVINAFHSSSFRIMHLAGHGVYRMNISEEARVCDTCGQKVEIEKEVTGMVIGKNTFLSPRQVENLRFVPELVFINCCHLGREEGADSDKRLSSPHKLAANIATQFIRMGSRAVVAAGWAVNDSAARLFATVFYEHMLGGDSFGMAVLQARKMVYRDYGNTNTWGAYQCYGDPDYRLVTDKGGYGSERAVESVSAQELVSQIAVLKQSASTASGASVVQFRNTLRQIDEKAPAEWKNDAAVRQAFAFAYAELDMFEQAIEHGQKAMELEKATYSVRLLEQVCHYKIKRAVELWQSAASDDDTSRAEKLCQEAIDELQDLNEILGETSERLNLIASGYKRKAMITKDEVRKEALASMEEYYLKAHRKKTGYVYPLFNWLSARMVNLWFGHRYDRSKLLEQIRELGAESQLDEQQIQDFWGLILEADVLVIRHLMEENLGKHVDKIVAKYVTARRGIGSPRETRSVLEQLRFLASMARETTASKKQRREDAESLETILERLEAGEPEDT